MRVRPSGNAAADLRAFFVMLYRAVATVVIPLDQSPTGRQHLTPFEHAQYRMLKAVWSWLQDYLAP